MKNAVKAMKYDIQIKRSLRRIVYARYQVAFLRCGGFSFVVLYSVNNGVDSSGDIMRGVNRSEMNTRTKRRAKILFLCLIRPRRLFNLTYKARLYFGQIRRFNEELTWTVP